MPQEPISSCVANALVHLPPGLALLETEVLIGIALTARLQVRATLLPSKGGIVSAAVTRTISSSTDHRTCRTNPIGGHHRGNRADDHSMGWDAHWLKCWFRRRARLTRRLISASRFSLRFAITPSEFISQHATLLWGCSNCSIHNRLVGEFLSSPGLGPQVRERFF